MRILKALDLKMARTVRVALWTGEEEGLLESRAYVRSGTRKLHLQRAARYLRISCPGAAIP
jgi:Zn-dependent M28 family amino/carboxypeptidase